MQSVAAGCCGVFPRCNRFGAASRLKPLAATAVDALFARSEYISYTTTEAGSRNGCGSRR